MHQAFIFRAFCLAFFGNGFKIFPEEAVNCSIQIWSDVMCPFCYIGKRRFEQALAQFEHKDEVEIEW
ncbi:hypothetical protein HK413_09415, partial [Mucilaginibacter sp. S1162]|nr:hypothetical protein [Mucilaginibacter humi]